MSEIDPKLSRLYRDASTESPPAALDAAILAVAHKQVAMSRRHERSQRYGRSFWSRWMAPASAIATLVLGVSIALLVEREQPGPSDNMAIRKISPHPQNPPAARGVESEKTKAADSAAPAVAARKETPATAVPVSPAPAQAPLPAVPAPVPELAAPVPAPMPHAAEAFPAERRASAAESEKIAPKAATESNVASDSALSGAGTLAPRAPAAPASAGKLAPLRQQEIQRSPEAWLDDISHLVREGRTKEAAEQLAEFRKAYPAYAVPEALRALQ